jgi:hypothetical protein
MQKSYSRKNDFTSITLGSELTVVYDRIYETNRIVYFSFALGYGWLSGTGSVVVTEKDPNGTGATIVEPEQNFSLRTDKVKAHLSLVGIRGGKHLCWYAELGYGYKGILNGGLAYRF